MAKRDFPEYEKLAGESLQEELITFLKTLQESDVDPIGFDLRYRSRHFHNKTEWETWKSLYPDIQFKANVEVQLEGVGIIE